VFMLTVKESMISFPLKEEKLMEKSFHVEIQTQSFDINFIGL